jgi:hypothetical protein
LKIEPQLPKFGSFRRIDSGLQIAFFQEVTPSRASILLGLTPFEIVQRSLGALDPSDYGNHPARLVAFLVEPNDRECNVGVSCHF